MKFLFALSLFFMSCSQIDNFPERWINYEPWVSRAIRLISRRVPQLQPLPLISTWRLLAMRVSCESFGSEIADQVELTNVGFTTDETLSNLQEFNILIYRTTLTIPPASELDFSTFDGLVRLNHGLGNGSGGESEKIAGRILVFPTGVAPETSAIDIEILTPTAGQSVPGGTVELTAQLLNEGEENYRVGWMVKDGEIPQRRSIETDWEGMTSGNKTVIVTVRGLTTGAVCYQGSGFYHRIGERPLEVASRQNGSRLSILYGVCLTVNSRMLLSYCRV